MKPARYRLLPLATFLSLSVSASTLQFGMDNDVLFKVDGDYSNGMFFGYSSSPSPLTSDSFLPLDPANGYQTNWSASIAHKMWTPSDIEQTTPQKNERPYAGLLAVDSGIVATNGTTAHQLGLLLGLVGPDSGAEDAQKRAHRLLGNAIPKGWDYQVKNKAIIDVSYEVDQLFYRSGNTPYQNEFSGYGRVVAGNFQPELAAGVGWRWGKSLENSFNANSLRPYRQHAMAADGLHGGWYLYGNLEARYRFDDLTITGSTLKPVPDVDMEKGQMTAASGVVYFYRQFGIGLSAVAYSKAFKQDQDDWHFRNSLTFYWLFM
ncbi:hypothetical protein GZ77_22475 [Endozoicomonas montiporae]|uniref:Exonuclease n=2 Tax=Endozoicomonas montiporae TaxID=1027273 RepID=A0A081N0B6_9GAMM|nr:lipid A deacylase LpxR family protein [Endozoicomonas montiporae]AMO54342.1 hypothetical protein EZMO1_0069 [Endozoicomonas montiporae CL-33]KEQ11889.1 hypothetical protein GZ77_22475 [Endozoicomonas montiporae]